MDKSRVATGAEALRLAEARQLVATGRGVRVREAARLSSRVAARVVGVSHATLRRWERGDGVPRDEQAALRWLAFVESLEERFPDLEQHAS